MELLLLLSLHVFEAAAFGTHVALPNHVTSPEPRKICGAQISKIYGGSEIVSCVTRSKDTKPKPESFNKSMKDQEHSREDIGSGSI